MSKPVRCVALLVAFLVAALWFTTIPSVLAGPTSTNFELKEFNYGAGGTEDSESTNYSLFGTVGEVDLGDLSGSTYKLKPGLTETIQAGVVPTPTLSNNGNTYYNKLSLNFSNGGNPTDAQFLIAISTDDFVADTRYIQADQTIGASQAWRTFAQWSNGSFNILSLNPSTTYYVKISSRQGYYTQSPFSGTDSEATVDTNITFTIGGVSSGQSVEGVTTDIATTSTEAAFGELQFNQVREGASLLTVDTNAQSGYTVTVAQTGALQTTTGDTFDLVSGTNESPSTWPSTGAAGAYGYHTSDASLGTGTQDRFLSDNTFARFEATAKEVAYGNTAVSNEQTHIVYSIEAGQAQEAGHYAHTITYIASAIY